jgi:hypothetical protein
MSSLEMALNLLKSIKDKPTVMNLHIDQVGYIFWSSGSERIFHTIRMVSSRFRKGCSLTNIPSSRTIRSLVSQGSLVSVNQSEMVSIASERSFITKTASRICEPPVNMPPLMRGAFEGLTYRNTAF